MMWVLTALLLRIHTGDLPDDRLLPMLRMAGVVFLQALPLALFLFFFLPALYRKTRHQAGRRIGRPDRHHPSGLHREAGTGRFRGDVRPFLTDNAPRRRHVLARHGALEL